MQLTITKEDDGTFTIAQHKKRPGERLVKPVKGITKNALALATAKLVAEIRGQDLGEPQGQS